MFFVTGSDQVWNPLFRSARGRIDNRLLTFAPPGKRVCFAPSIGLNDLPQVWQQTFIRDWNRYPRLSVRETGGADLIRRLTGRDAEVVVDPTLMLDRQQWLSAAKPLPGFSGDNGYLLYFMPGGPEQELSGETKKALDGEVEKTDCVQFGCLTRTTRFFVRRDPGK